MTGEQPYRFNLRRRQVLVAAAGSVALLGGANALRAFAAQNPARLPNVDASPKLAYFTSTERAFVDAAVDRLIPSDVLGPGAMEAGVTVFIDHQLAGPYGKAERWYMTGPWQKGIPEQGYQSRLTPAQMYRAAIAAVDAHTAKAFHGRAFAALDASDQEALLHQLEGGKIDLGEAPSKTFFTLLWENTQQGFFADPIYLGNRNFAGWKLLGFPGPRYNYDGAILRFGQIYPLPTVGLMGPDPSVRTEHPL